MQSSKKHPKIRAYIALMRPQQWSKNAFIFAPAFFGFGQYEFSAVWANLLIAFASFCLLSSSIYCLNDVIDCAADRAHPSKKFRPVASGVLSKANALVLALCLLIAGGGGEPLPFN